MRALDRVRTSVTGLRTEGSRDAVVEQTAWLNANHRSTEYPNEAGTAARYFKQVRR